MKENGGKKMMYQDFQLEQKEWIRAFIYPWEGDLTELAAYIAE